MAKTRRCKNCKTKNEKFAVIGINAFCDYDCAAKFGREKAKLDKEKADKKKHAARKKKFKDNDKPLREREAQKAVNAYIRKRDEKELCISCRNELKNPNGYIGKSGVHAGHYKSRGGYPELRFEELNINSQCYRCNVQLSGNIENYRINLVEKIGLEKVEWLEGPHKAKKYTCAELKEIELKYKAKLKDLN